MGRPRPIIRALRSTLLALAFMATGMAVAEASAAQCRALAAELASTGNQGRSASRIDASATAYRRQAARAQADYAAAGCNSLFSRLRPQCNAIRSAISHASAQVAALEAATGPSGAARRSAILRRMQVAGCTGAVARRGEAPAARREGGRRQTVAAPAASASGPRGGNLRAMCVRSCDGYYFPVAHGTSPANLLRDQANCEAMCPGAKVQIFHHRLDRESDTMISAGGNMAYSDLPNAYRYRQAGAERSYGCSCTATTAPRGFTVIAGDHGAATPGAGPDAAAADRADISAALRGRLDFQPLASIKRGAEPAERRVRVVGPAFLPDP